MFVNKFFTYLTCAYLKKQKAFYCEVFNKLFSYEDEDIGRISNLYWCTFKGRFIKVQTVYGWAHKIYYLFLNNS